MSRNEDRTELGEDGSVRKAHYGDGKQPIDHIIAAGWGPEFCAGNVLKYLRRTKEPEHSLESARWYWARLLEFAERGHAKYVMGQLVTMLTREELNRISGAS